MLSGVYLDVLVGSELLVSRLHPDRCRVCEKPYSLADSGVRGSGLTSIRLVLSVLFGLFVSTNSSIAVIGFVFVAVIATAIAIVLSMIGIIKNDYYCY